MKCRVIGRGVVVEVTDGELGSGFRERIRGGKLEGFRRKRALVKIIGE